jgi:predicted hydrolase (HD superfamily)
MALPTREEAKKILEKYVKDDYQRFHALMVATAMEGYAKKLGQDGELWFLTGYLHDLDYFLHPTTHPGPSLEWFKDWGYPDELIQAVLAHANGFNGFAIKPESLLDKALIACDEICGIFYAYQKLNPVPFGEMKASSILKRLRELKFAPKIDRLHIENGCKDFGVKQEEHATNLIEFFKNLPLPNNNQKT